MKADDIRVRYAELNTNIVVRNLDRDWVLLELNPIALRFLAEQFLALAETNDEKNSDRTQGCRKVFFSKRSKKGLCIWKVPVESAE